MVSSVSFCPGDYGLLVKLVELDGTSRIRWIKL